MPGRYDDVQLVNTVLMNPPVSAIRLPAIALQRVEGSYEYRPLREHAVAIHVVFQSGSASLVGNQLVDLDRELRRTASSLSPVGYLQPSAPIPVAEGELGVLYARPGSAHLLVAAYDSLTQILLSRPVEALIALTFFWDRRPARWTADSRSRAFSAGEHASLVPPAESSVQIIESLRQAAKIATSQGHLVRFKLTLDRDRVECEFETVSPDDTPF